MALTFGSLFAGIGGFDLGFERAGMVPKWQVEIDDYATRVLAKHWPDVHRERDIRECGSHNLERVDVICGGFPCQDISYAGLGAGLDGERSGLFFEAIRVVRELRPRIVVLENVAALLTRGLDRVLGMLAEIGFDAEWHCIPAAAVGAPHIRDRVFVVGVRPDAFSKGTRHQSRTDCGQAREHSGASKPETLRQAHRASRAGRFESVREDVSDATNNRARRWEQQQECGEEARNVANTNEPGPQGRNSKELREREGKRIAGSRDSLQEFRDRSGGQQWLTEPDVGRVANGVPSRVDRLRGLGNAVVPQVAEWIGRRIIEATT